MRHRKRLMHSFMYLDLSLIPRISCKGTCSLAAAAAFFLSFNTFIIRTSASVWKHLIVTFVLICDGLSKGLQYKQRIRTNTGNSTTLKDEEKHSPTRASRNGLLKSLTQLVIGLLHSLLSFAINPAPCLQLPAIQNRIDFMVSSTFLNPAQILLICKSLKRWITFTWRGIGI
jgi:hypothetical protein